MKFKVEVPITAFFTVEVEAGCPEEAIDSVLIKPPKLCLQCNPKLEFSQDGIDWEKVEAIPIEEES